MKKSAVFCVALLLANAGHTETPRKYGILSLAGDAVPKLLQC